MLYAAEIWAMTLVTHNSVRRNDPAMIRWICNVKAKDEVSLDPLLSKLGIHDMDEVLRTSRMGWFGHVEHSTDYFLCTQTKCTCTEETRQVEENLGGSAGG